MTHQRLLAALLLRVLLAEAVALWIAVGVRSGAFVWHELV